MRKHIVIENETACAQCGWPLPKGARAIATEHGTCCSYWACVDKLAERKRGEAEAQKIRQAAVLEWNEIRRRAENYDPDLLLWRQEQADRDRDRLAQERRHDLANEAERERGVYASEIAQRAGGHIARSIAALGLLLSSWAYAQEPKFEFPGPVSAIVSAYCGCKSCCGDFRGKIRGQTASGKMAKPMRTIAAPKDIPFGTEIWIVEGDGSGGRLGKGVCLGIVEDRGGAIRWRKKDGKPVLRIDVYFATHEEALQFGIHGVEVRITKPAKEEKR